ncbi:hypothetical protein J4T85_019455 [Sinorhizobium medicae]|uniref:hypothetical protein n=1 Tax=Sinorhizobium medicae TaxID=110321 RepID=UPI001AAE28C1|nr:hypothetical protein [Sinorhizobium medicae]MBO1963884.1 hypothetical protein [Sinorhizobium medicae]
MTKAELAARLHRLRPELVNIVGFYDLLDHGDEVKCPLAAMTHQVHFTAASLKLAREIIHILGELEADGE